MPSLSTPHQHQARLRGWVLRDGGFLYPAFVLAAAAAIGRFIEPWVWMWTLAVTIFAGCKWLTWREAVAARTLAPASRSIAYLVAWPGLNAREFLDTQIHPVRPVSSEWLAATFKTCLGAMVLWVGCRPVLFALRQDAVAAEMFAGWIGMIGLILFLHFGVFHLLSLVWRSVGVQATPLFDRPATSKSLSDFWGHRWNRAFRDLAHQMVFQPLTPGIGAAWAMMACFVASGLVHDLVISLPARGGYGLPTAYFTLQGCGVLFERSSLGRRWGLRRGFRGWLFMALVTAAPAYLLFHPPFVRNVFVPFLRAIGAI